MTFVLENREYQDRCVAACLAFMQQPRKKKRHGVAVLPCGSGKSLIAARVILGLDAPAILFQPRKELLLQNLEKLRLYGYEPSVFSASVGRREVGEITLATIKSVIDYPDYFQDVRYVLVDECSDVSAKGGEYLKFIKALHPEVVILGLDATPFRMASNSDGTELRFITRTVPRIFNEVVCWVQIQELFDGGYLQRPSYFSMAKEVPFDEAQLTLNSAGSAWTDDSVQRHLFEIGFNEKLASVVKRLIAKERKGILVFTRTVIEAEYLAKEVPGVAMLTTKTSDGERARILEAFTTGRIQTLVNVGIAGIGFDYPALDTVVLGRVTMSLRVYYQQIGRGLRKAEGKDSFWVVDMVRLTDRFGKIDDLRLYCEGDRQWAFWGKVKGKDIQLTNKVLAGTGGGNGMRCKSCGTPITWMKYYKPNVQGKVSSLPLSRPKGGMRPNILIEKNAEDKDVCRIVTSKDSAEDQARAEYVSHFANCPNAGSHHKQRS